MKGFDQTLNVILGEAHERIFSLAHGVELMSLGLYIVRGDNMCVQDTLVYCHSTNDRLLWLRSALIGELDDDLDRTLDFENITAAPLRPVVH